MARPRIGNVEKYRRVDGKLYYRARIRIADGTRVRVDVPEKHATSDDRARDPRTRRRDW